MMKKELFGRWYISAFLYRITYSRIAHQLDDEMIDFLGDLVSGGLVADCGCGPGIVAEKFLSAGAKRIVTIDVNPMMLYQTRRRLEKATRNGSVVTIQAAFEPQLFRRLYQQITGSIGFDVILFKRSLYLKPENAFPILRAAAATLSEDGVLVVIHPDRSLRNYIFGGLNNGSFLPFHLVIRSMSILGEKLGLGTYTLYNREELVQFVSEAVTPLQAEVIPSQQKAYNLVAVRKNGG